MDNLSPSALILVLCLLVVISGLFSSAETGMMALNRYKLRHLAKAKHRRARLVVKLLERPDRLLGVVLIGNTFANNLASIVAVLLAENYFGGLGMAITMVSIGLTLVLLIFAEMGPKIIAASYPQQVAFFSVFPLTILLRVFYPFVWLANTVANGLLRVVGVSLSKTNHDHLTREELRSLLREANDVIPLEHQHMLLGILELEEVVVNDIMVPRNDVCGIDLNQPWQAIMQQLQTSSHAYLALYRDSIDNVEVMLQVRKILPDLLAGRLDKSKLLALAEEAYFIPEGTALTKQLLEFKAKKCRVGLVVDEYGELCGLVTLEDILEEIVGEYTTNLTPLTQEIRPQADGSVLVAGNVSLRDLNRLLGWSLPIDGPKTLNGLIVEYLETLPEPGIDFLLANYRMEVLTIQDNTVKIARIRPEADAAVSTELNDNGSSH